MALIVLVHLGFFWALSNGLPVYIFPPDEPGKIVYKPLPHQPPPTPTPLKPVEPVVKDIWVPNVRPPQPLPDDDTGPLLVTRDPVPLPPPTTVTDEPGAGPLILQPQVDPRYPFTEPEYPTPDIRMGHEGTVWLTIEILPNGRVGAVRVDQTSGFVRLDESAVREARKWRMKPGTQDGIAIPMYKRVPVTFRLKD
jgi:protein TonB